MVGILVATTMNGSPIPSTIGKPEKEKVGYPPLPSEWNTCCIHFLKIPSRSRYTFAECGPDADSIALVTVYERPINYTTLY